MRCQPGGGGGGGYSPQIFVGMCRGKVKNGQGLRNELPVERENAGLQNELEPFWTWKWGAPERTWSVLSVKMGVSGTAKTRLANPRRCLTLCVRAEPAVGGDERVEIKEILKMMVSWTAKSAKICKMVMLFGNLWKCICSGTEIQGWKWGSLARHIPNMHTYGSTPPPPRDTSHKHGKWLLVLEYCILFNEIEIITLCIHA